MLPLESITVLDFSQAFNGPYGTMTLADMGARVIKVERPTGEQSRYWFPFAENGESAYYAVHNRNKEGIAVDLRSDEGKEIIKKLYEKVDVVVENFKYGTIDKLGLGWEVASKINPGIIFASSSGYGQGGPLATNTAYDNIIESMCGYMDMTGDPDFPPLRSGASVGDSYTGITMALGVAMACYRKKKTGQGMRVDISMLDTMFAALEDSILTYALTGEPLHRSGNAKPKEVVPYDAYYCREDRYVAVSVTEERQWPGFCRAVGKPEWIHDPRYATNDQRVAHFEEFTKEMKSLMREQDADDFLARCREEGVAAAEAVKPRDLYHKKYVSDRDMIIEYEDENMAGPLQTFGLPVKFSKTPEKIRRCSPRLGQHTRDVLYELGYPKKQVDDLAQRGIVKIHGEDF